MSTRTKTYVNEKTHRCLRWKNETALRENGHKHAEPPPNLGARRRKRLTRELRPELRKTGRASR